MSKSAPRLMKGEEARFLPRFEYGDQAQSASLCGSDDGSQLGAGLVRLSGANIPWVIKYDEIIFVVEGEFTVQTPEATLTARAGDSIWLPAGTALNYKAEKALLFYAIHPADWATKE